MATLGAIEPRNKIEDGIAPRWYETKKEMVLRDTDRGRRAGFDRVAGANCGG
jgi:hypothetical protein